MTEKKDNLLFLDEARSRRKEEKKQQEKKETQEKSVILTPEEERYLTAFDWDNTKELKSETERIVELKRRAEENKNKWESEEWSREFIGGAGFELGSSWIDEQVGRDRFNRIIELTKKIERSKIEEIKQGFDRFQYKGLEIAIESVDLEKIADKPAFYRAAIEFVLEKYGMKIEDLD